MTRRHHGAARARGFTLVELMVAMVLGLIFIGGAVSLMLANRRSYSTNEGLSQMQESARSAFEMLARDIRQAGVTGCDNNNRIANVLATAGSGVWWQDWFGLNGYTGAQASPGAAFGGAARQRVAGTDAIQTQGIQGLGMAVLSHAPATALLTVNATAPDIATGDIMLVCDFDHATIFQVTGYNPATLTLEHAAGGGPPGNCFADLRYSSLPPCTTPPSPPPYQFDQGSLLAHFSATEWFIGNSGRSSDSGRSLFRQRMDDATAEEVVADVTDMRISYRVDGDDTFVAASLLGSSDWADVNAVRIDLTVSSADARISADAAVNAGRLERNFSQVIALRNRIP